MAAIRSRLLGVLPAGLRFPVGPRLLCSAPPLWWRKGRPRTTHRSFAEVELLSHLAQLLMPGEPVCECFRDFPVKKSELWDRPWLCPDISAFGVLKEEDAALFVEYDGYFRHSEPQGRQRDERKTEVLLAHAPAGSHVLRIGHAGRGLRVTDNSIEAIVDVWRAGHSSSLKSALHQATRTLLASFEGVLQHEVRERLHALKTLEGGAEPLRGFDNARKFVTEAVLTRDVETKKANMLAVLEGDLQLSGATIQALESKFPSIWGVNIESKLKPIVAWLEDVGLSRPQTAKVVARHPRVLGCSIDDNLKPTVAWLEDVGLSRVQVVKVVAGFPQVLSCSIEANLKPTVAWLEDVGLSRTQVAQVVARFPQVLGYSIEANLKPTVAWLEDVGLSREHVAKVVAGCPQVLGFSIDGNLKPTVAWLEDVGLSREQVSKVVATLPQVLSYSIDGNLKPTVAWFAEVGLSRQQVAKVASIKPQVFGYSIENNLSRKHFLLQQFYSKEQICSMIAYQPAMLGYGYARMYIRLKVLQEHGCLCKLAQVMALTDEKFSRRFPA